MNEPIYLRALETSDLDRCHTWHNDRTLYTSLCDHFRFVSREAEGTWLGRKNSYATANDEVNLAMCVRETDRHVGNIYLRDINWISRHGALHILIGEREERSKGYGQSAVRQLLTYAFHDLGLNKVHLAVLSENKAAIRVYEKCGFSVEGTLRNHEFKEGQWKDLVIMGVCARDDWSGLNGR